MVVWPVVTIHTCLISSMETLPDALASLEAANLRPLQTNIKRYKVVLMLPTLWRLMLSARHRAEVLLSTASGSSGGSGTPFP